MRKVKWIAVAIVMAIAVQGASAQVRFDMGLDLLGGFGTVTQAFGGVDTNTQNVLNSIVLPFPEFGVSYQFDLGGIRLGAGVRCFSLILVTIGFPNVYAEMDFGPWNVQAQIGGLLFFAFGILPATTTTGPFVIPDVMLSYKFSDNFKVGLGVAAVMHRDYMLDAPVIPFIWYVGAKFSWY